MNIGWIVVDHCTDEPLTLLKEDNSIWLNIPKEGILLKDPCEVTQFLTRMEAIKAVFITQIYFKQLGEELSSYRLMRICKS